MLELILVSQSPRRRTLLLNEGFVFRTDTVKVSENIEENLNIGAAIEAVAESKAQEWVRIHKPLKLKDFLLLSADTVVFYNGEVLGKPKNEGHAAEILGRLSGKTHSVITGICLWSTQNNEKILAHDRTEVEFFELSEKQILDYVKTGEPMDKAGAYGIQGEGRHFVKSTHGSWSNVVGLPMELVKKLIKEHNWNVPRK